MTNLQKPGLALDTASMPRAEHDLTRLSTRLVRSEMTWVGRALLRGLLVRWRARTIRAEHATTAEGVRPTGPFEMRRPGERGDLLLWVPRGIDSYLIDELTGGYGYSHATIDTGEIDLPTGKPVMAEITIKQTVSHKFLNEYGQRPYVRVPLVKAGVDVGNLLGCVESKMGEQYDSLDALTLGEIRDPAKEVCSGLVTDCLPDDELRNIAWAMKLGLLQRRSVSIHSKLDAARVRAFVSPNALAEYYGAPRGRKVQEPETVVLPKPVGTSAARVATLGTRHQGWKAVAALAALAVLIITIRRRGL